MVDFYWFSQEWDHFAFIVLIYLKTKKNEPITKVYLC